MKTPHLIRYHARMIGQFLIANKAIASAMAALLIAATCLAIDSAVSRANGIGVEASRADALVYAFSTEQAFAVSWCFAPAAVQILLSLLFHRTYSENFRLRWKSRRLVRAGQAFDALVLSWAAALVVFATALLVSSFRELVWTNFSDAHSLFSYFTQTTLPCEPEQMVFLTTMFLYVALAVSIVNQLFLVINKAVANDLAAIMIVFAFGFFRLYDARTISAFINQAYIEAFDACNPLRLFYSVGDVGYASWLAPSLHGLPAMIAVLIALFLINVHVPSTGSPSLLEK